MSKFLQYFNEVLESLDIPTISTIPTNPLLKVNRTKKNNFNKLKS